LAKDKRLIAPVGVKDHSGFCPSKQANIATEANNTHIPSHPSVKVKGGSG